MPTTLNIPITSLSGAVPMPDASGYRFVVQFLNADTNEPIVDARLTQNQTFIRTSISTPFILPCAIAQGNYTINNVKVRVHSDSTGSGKYKDATTNIAVNCGYTMSIGSISHSIAYANPVVPAPDCFFAINLLEPNSFRGVKDFTLKIFKNGVLQNGPSGYLTTGLDTSAYPAIIFDPKNPVWGFTGPGDYVLQVSTIYGGSTYQDSETITLLQNDFDCNTGGGGGGSNDGFVITGIGQVVTGANPQQSWHTVESPARVINITATPPGTYDGSVTINGHTEVFENLNVSSAGYPAVYFNPANQIWGISTPGTYSIQITLNIGGSNYTQNTTTVVTNADLGLDESGDGFVITGIGQVVTGASPQQSWHTVESPARVINITATPPGTYSAAVTINGHTEVIEGTNFSPSGYPAVYFDPTNSVWGIVSAGVYTIQVVLNIGGTNYTKTTTTTITNTDLGITGGGGGGEGTADAEVVGYVEPANPNENVEMVVTPFQIIGRFKIAGGTGNYNITAKKDGVTVGTGSMRPYSTYTELTINRFYNQEDLAGKTLVWECEKSGTTTSFTFFTPECVTREYQPKITFSGQNAEYPDLVDRILMLRYTKPFDSGRIKVEDVGENLGMNPFYWKNGSIYRSGGVYNSSILSPRLVPAMRYIQILKYLVDPRFENINGGMGISLFSQNTFFGKEGARLECWFRTAANQNI